MFILPLVTYNFELLPLGNNDPGFGFNPFQGRGAPEIDLLEVMPGVNYPAFELSPKQSFEIPVLCHSEINNTFVIIPSSIRFDLIF